jgi:hypothetical protein
MPFVELLKSTLNLMLLEAARAGAKSAEISAAGLRDRLPPLRPGIGDQIHVCCQVMRAALSPDAGDTILEDPPAGQEANLRKRYVLPRPARQ